MKLGILASGKIGSNALERIINEHKVMMVMTDKNSTEIINYCQKNGLDVYTGNPRGGKATEFIKDISIEVLISINYLFLIEDDLIQLPSKMAINIHGSLLPKYRGRTPHVWAIINNESMTGITVHLIDDGCDTGQIIEQINVPIKRLDTGADILNKFTKLYVPLILSVLKRINENNIVYYEQNETYASYFGRRTPGDGKIDWDWQKERITNWIRAQAYPYPGAYTFYDKDKIVIDEVANDDYGFTQEMRNGLILTISPIRVKTPNGVLRINKLRNNLNNIKSGKTLS
jgi:methionyl-tRNA formyltransferase